MENGDLQSRIEALRKKQEGLEGARDYMPGDAFDLAWQTIQQQIDRLIDTGGGPYVENLSTGGGDAVMGDQAKIEADNISGGVQVVGTGNTVHLYYQTYRQVEGSPALSEDEFKQFLTNYLNWVANYYDRARLFGMERLGVNENRPSGSLQEVFIPLSLCRIKPPRREEIEEQLAEAGDPEGLERIKAYLHLVSERQKEAIDVSLTDLLTTAPRLAIIGGPGCGKSTLLNFLAVRLALHIHHGSPLPFNLTRDRPAPVPLVIPLRGYREYRNLCQQSPQRRLDEPHTGTLAGYILYALNHYGGRMGSFTADGFERLMLGGSCLVMLDGLDEVVDRRERGRVREEVENLANGYPGNQFLVTAREAGYQEQAIFSDRFTRLDVRSLDLDQIRQLVENWCRQLYKGEEAARTDEIFTAIKEINERRSDSELPPLVTTPLMTTMVVGVKWSRTQLPRDRAKLYDAAVEVILQLQYSQDDAAREQLIEWGGTIDEQREWLWTLAYEMHRGGRGAAVVSQDTIRRLLQPRLSEAALNRFIEAIHERGGLLEERAGLYQFAHLTFQEFLTARCIVDRRLGQQALSTYVADPWWREVLLLAHGIAVYAAPGYARSLLAWLSELPGQARLAGLELAGAAVLEIDKPNPDLRRQQAEKLAGALTDSAQSYPVLLRAEAGRILAELGDPRPEVMTVEGMLFCFVTGGPFQMGSDPRRDAKAYDDEQPQHTVDLPDFWLGQHPVTNAQFDWFVQAGGYAEARYWGESIDAGYWKEGRFKGDYGSDWREGPYPYGVPFGLANHPVVGVSWYEALAFTRWLEEQARAAGWLSEGWRIGLPSEAEWEKAARGGQRVPAAPRGWRLDRLLHAEPGAYREEAVEAWEYPWRGDFDAGKANTDESGIGATSAVGCFPGGAGPYGHQDLSGNVWEWTRSLSQNYPYEPRDKSREDLKAGSRHGRVLRGGSWVDDGWDARCASRDWYFPSLWSHDLGFRVVVLPSSSDL